MNKNFAFFFLVFAILFSGCAEDGIGEAFKPLSKEAACFPSTEICDGKDNDCDTQIDEERVCETSAQAITALQCHSGNYCVKAIKGNLELYQPLTLEPNTEYILSYWSLLGNYSEGTRITICSDNDLSYCGETYFGSLGCDGNVTEDWNQTKCVFTTPDSTNDNPKLVITAGSGNLDLSLYNYVDDVELRKTGEGNIAFKFDTQPDSRNYDGTDTGISIENISGSESTMTATVSVSAPSPMPSHPDLEEKIKEGIIEIPYAIKKRNELIEKGLDQPGEFKLIDYLESKALTKTISEADSATDFKILVILADFSDNVSQVEPLFFDSLIFSETESSVRLYYRENSYSQLDIITVNLPSSMGWKRAPETYSYYVNAQQGIGGYPQNSQKLAEDLIEIIDPTVDFSEYDNDGDGKVEGLVIVHTGPGAEKTGSSNDIWSHAWGISTQNRDGVDISRYSIQPEYWTNPEDMTIGVYCHEIGHLFGLPDLYDYDYDSHGLGLWSVMALGSWSGPNYDGSYPSHFDAWSKVKLGFINPKTPATSPATIQLPNSENSNQGVFRLWTDNDLSSEEYFLIENRQKIGYDTYLPGKGLLIWHIDETVNTRNNKQWYPSHTDDGHYMVALEQADGKWELEKKINYGNYKDAYPNATQTYENIIKNGNFEEELNNWNSTFDELVSNSCGNGTLDEGELCDYAAPLGINNPYGDQCNEDCFVGGNFYGWFGCRGTGVWVCVEKVSPGFPNYFDENPLCIEKTDCGEQYYRCNETFCPSPCTDSDNGIKIFEKGLTKDLQDVLEGAHDTYDYCTLNGVEVFSCTETQQNCGIVENYCNSNNDRSVYILNQESFDSTCRYGCRGGECLSCKDSDNGINNTVTGTCSEIFEKGISVNSDYCSGDNINEAYCNSGEQGFCDYYPPTICYGGCSDGKCNPICTVTSNGCTDNQGLHSNYCLDSSRIIKYACPDPYGNCEEKIPEYCSIGCIEGTCITTCTPYYDKKTESWVYPTNCGDIDIT